MIDSVETARPSNLIAGRLKRVLETDPQIGSYGELRWILGAGWSIELLTAKIRPHHDVDIVILGNTRLRPETASIVDCMYPEYYWGGLKLNDSFLIQTSRTALFKLGDFQHPVIVVNPAITLAHKLSGEPLRLKDREDIRSLIRMWRKNEGYNQEWQEILNKSLVSLNETERSKALGRLEELTEHLVFLANQIKV